MDNVNSAEVQLFKRTLLARRFPGLQALRERDVAQLVLADRKAGHNTQADHKLYPQTHPQAKVAAKFVSNPHVFAPASPAEAKHTVKRAESECYLNTKSPYDMDHQSYLVARTCDGSKNPYGVFYPSHASQAKKSISVDYYLYSPEPGNMK